MAMSQQELTQLLPDLVDGSITDDDRRRAEAVLPFFPEVQRDLEIARMVRSLLVTLQSEYPNLRVSPSFEARLLARVRKQSAGMEILDISCVTFSQWLIEFINLVGGLIVPISPARPTDA